MSIVLTHRCLVRNVFAVPFHTNDGIGFHYFSCISLLHVPRKVHLSCLKCFYKPQEVPSKTPKVDEKPIQDPSTVKTVSQQIQDQEVFDGLVTMGGAPSPRHLPIPMFYVRERIKKSSF